MADAQQNRYFVDSVPTQDAIGIFERYAAGDKVRDIARDFGVHPSLIIDVAVTVRGVFESLEDVDAPETES